MEYLIRRKEWLTSQCHASPPSLPGGIYEILASHVSARWVVAGTVVGCLNVPSVKGVFWYDQGAEHAADTWMLPLGPSKSDGCFVNAFQHWSGGHAD